MLKIKRVYDGYDKNDGFRILVDRLWPRGVSKANAHIELWLKDLAPSSTLRKWFNHDPKKWPTFQKRYLKELEENLELVEQVKKIIKDHQSVTLLYAAKDKLHNEAVVLLNYLR